MQLSSVEKAGGRQVPRHREAGRRKHGTTMTRRTPRKGRLRPGKFAAYPIRCSFHLLPIRVYRKGRLWSGHTCRQRSDVTLLGWRGQNGCERHDTFNLEKNSLDDIRHYRETPGTKPNREMETGNRDRGILSTCFEDSPYRRMTFLRDI